MNLTQDSNTYEGIGLAKELDVHHNGKDDQFHKLGCINPKSTNIACLRSHLEWASLVPGPCPAFRRSVEKQGRPGKIYHVSDIRVENLH